MVGSFVWDISLSIWYNVYMLTTLTIGKGNNIGEGNNTISM
jgi:hypothetical protein